MSKRLLRDVQVRLAADTSVYRREMDRASRQGADYYRSMSEHSRRAQVVMRAEAAQMQRLQQQVQAVQSRMTTMAAGITAGLSAGKLIAMAEGHREMAERIRMTTANAAEYEAVQARLLVTANGTYRSLAEAQELYIQTSDSLKRLGYGTDEALDITDSLSYAFVKSATSAARAESATNALARSVQTGKVSADDWRSMLTAIPSLLSDVAATSTHSAAEIEKLGASGALSLVDLTEGIRRSLTANKEAADGMATTVGDAMVNLQNNLGEYMRAANDSTGATQMLVKGLEAIGNNIDNVVKGAVVLGAAFGTRSALRWGLDMASAAKSTVQMAVAQRELNQAQLAAATAVARRAEANLQGAQLEMTRARAAVAAAKEEVQATREVIAEKVRRRQIDLQQIRSEIELQRISSRVMVTEEGRRQHALKLLALRQQKLVTNRALQAAETELAGTTVSTSRAVAAALRAESVAHRELSQAADQSNKARYGVGAASAAARSAGVLATAGRGLLGVLGGPAGLAGTVASIAAGYLLFRDSADEATKTLDAQGKKVAEVAEAFRELHAEQQRQAMREYTRELKQYQQEAQDAWQGIYRALMPQGRQAAGTLGVSINTDAVGVDVEQIWIRIKAAQAAGQDLGKVIGDLQREFNLPDKLVEELDQWISKFRSASEQAQHSAAVIRGISEGGGARQEVNDQRQIGERLRQQQATQSAIQEIEKYRLQLRQRMHRAEDTTEYAAALRHIQQLGIAEEDNAARALLTDARRADAMAAMLEREKDAQKQREQAEQRRLRSAEQLIAASQSQYERYQESLLLRENATELERLGYELQFGKLRGLADEHQQRLRIAATLTDQVSEQRRYQEMMRDLARDEDRIGQVTRERLQALKEMQSITDSQRAAARDAIVEQSVSKAPGLDKSYGNTGYGGDLLRVGGDAKQQQEWYDLELKRQSAFLDQKLLNEEEYSANVRRIDEQNTRARADLQQQYVSAAIGSFSQLTGDVASLMEQMGDRSSTAYKTMFAISKAAAIAQAIVSTEVSAAKALELGPIFGIPAASLVRGLGYASVGIIAAQSIVGMAHDGISDIPREGTWLLQKGERVVDSRTNADLKSYLALTRGQAAPAGGGDVRVTVNVQADGQTQTSDVAWSDMGEQIGAVVNQVLTKRLRAEQRPGGMLYRRSS